MVIKPTIIYVAWKARIRVNFIEVVPCPACQHPLRSAGADLARLEALFNWSNMTIFSHALLNEFESAMTRSENPSLAFK